MKRYFFYFKDILISIFLGDFFLRKFACPYCNQRVFFISLGKNTYKNRCLNCRSTLISLSVIKVLNTLPLKVFESSYELSYHGVVFNHLKSTSIEFTFSEYFPDSKSRYVNSVRNEDVQSLTFESNKFSLITSTEVFEHVPNYLKGFKEVYRVLKKDGFFCFTVPVFEISKQICKLHQDGSLLWLAPEEYHGSRLTGDESVPVFWHHSREQIIKDLIATGFKEAKAINHFWFDKINQIVFVAKK